MTISQPAETQVTAPRAVVHTLLRSLASERGVSGWLTAIVGLSFLFRWLASLSLRTPFLLPDEYIYRSLARSIAHSGHATVRGVSSHFPALLDPILIAPFWVGSNVELSYRLTQGFHALAMSLSVIPAYLLARRLEAGRPLALALSLVAVAIPDLLLSGFVLTEAIAYPLVLTAVLLGVRALERPTTARQLLFVLAAAAAAFARIQFVALFAAFFAVAIVGERFHPRVVRRFLASFCVVVVPAVIYMALKGRGGLGYYNGVFGFGLHPLRLLRWTGIDLMLMAYAAGLALVPGALLGSLAEAIRPRSESGRVYARFFLFFAAFLLVEAVLYATNGSDRFQERYLFSLIPLLAVSFLLFVPRARELRLPTLLLAGVLFVLSVRVPLGPYAVASGAQDSPFLGAVAYLTSRFGQGSGALAVALVAAPLRRGVPLAVAASIAVLVAASYASTDRMAGRTRLAQKTYLGADPRSIDGATRSSVAFLNLPLSNRALPLELMFWNTRLDRIVDLPYAATVDSFGSTQGRIARDGTLLVAGHPFHGPLVVGDWGTRTQLSGATRLAEHVNWTLWQPGPRFRFSSITYGLFFDGWLAADGWTTVWPDRSGQARGVVRYRLTLPAGLRRDEPMTFETTGFSRQVLLRPGRTTTVDVPISRQDRPARIHFRVVPPLLIVLQDRALSALATVEVVRKP
jgi:hypothetical protein